MNKIARICLRIFLVLVLTSVTGLGVIYVFLQNNSEELANKYLDEISRKAGVDISFKSIHVTLIPLPAIGIGDLNIRGKGYELNIAWLSLRPALENLLHGELFPGSIIVLRPKFYMQSEGIFDNPLAVLQDMEKNFKNGSGSSSEIQSIIPQSCNLKIIQGYSQISDTKSKVGIFNNLETALELDSNGDLSGKLNLGNFRIWEGKKNVFALESVSMEGSCNLENFFEQTNRLDVSGRLKTSYILNNADFKASLEYSDLDWFCNLDILADLDLEGTLIPASYRGRIFSMADSMEIISRRSEFTMDADSGKMELRLRLPMQGLPWNLEGKLFLHRASLTQWLGFARGLPPGLQIALDNVSNARLDFVLTSKFLKVDNIVASSSGATFTGTGGVADFAHPVVELDLKSKKVNLGLAIPESLIKSPEPVYFPYKPLTPESGIPLEEGEEGVGYDIKLSATDLIYGPVIINNAKLRIYPGKMDIIRLEDVLLDATGEFYGGSVKASCILGADPSLPTYIASTIKNVNMSALVKAMPVLPLKKGIFQGEGKVFSRGKTLVEFLNNLDGPVSITGRDVVLEGDSKEKLSKLVVKSQLKGGAILKNGVSFGGKWELEANTNIINSALAMDGKLLFNNSGLSIKSLPSTIKINFAEKAGIIPAKSSFTIKGQISGKSDSNQFSMEKLSLEAPGAVFNGKISLNTKTINYSGELTANIQDSRKFFHYFSGSNVNVPRPFSSISFNCDYNSVEKGIVLNKVKIKSGDIQANGNVNVLFQTIPSLEFNLNLNGLDWNSQFAGDDSHGKEKWDFVWLKSFNCKGTIKADFFSGWGLKFTSISFPVQLQNGKLTITDMKARFYGTVLKAQVEADFNKNMAIKTIISANGFKLEDVAKDQKLESVLIGDASVGATLSANLSGSGQIPAKLDGIWNFRIVSGSWQGRDKNGKLKGSKTRFDLARASGIMRGGRMESNDILLKNNEMQISGEGWLNLNSHKIDCKLNVNMDNLPEFPLYVYGKMDNPTTSIGAGKLVLNALGGITSGIGNLFGSLVKGLGNIFR